MSHVCIGGAASKFLRPKLNLIKCLFAIVILFGEKESWANCKNIYVSPNQLICLLMLMLYISLNNLSVILGVTWDVVYTCMQRILR